MLAPPTNGLALPRDPRRFFPCSRNVPRPSTIGSPSSCSSSSSPSMAASRAPLPLHTCSLCHARRPSMPPTAVSGFVPRTSGLVLRALDPAARARIAFMRSISAAMSHSACPAARVLTGEPWSSPRKNELEVWMSIEDATGGTGVCGAGDRRLRSACRLRASTAFKVPSR